MINEDLIVFTIINSLEELTERYINWIEYNFNIGIDKIIIGYNCNINKDNELLLQQIKELYNDNIIFINVYSDNEEYNKINKLNILYNVIKNKYNNVSFSINLNSDEYIYVNSKKYRNNIKLFLRNKYNHKFDNIKISYKNINKYDLSNYSKYRNIINVKFGQYVYFLDDYNVCKLNEISNLEVFKSHIYFDKELIYIIKK